ncbi:hypothetical protein PSY52_23130, partial [Shigella flexneri]|nr:hypothetical protein [Shigella flexneri]
MDTHPIIRMSIEVLLQKNSELQQNFNTHPIIRMSIEVLLQFTVFLQQNFN